MRINKVVLIEPRSPGTHFFSHIRIPLLGLPILGEILRRMNFRVKVFCENFAPINWQEVAEADLVGISALTSLAPRAYQIAKEVKRIAENAIIVMGGPHVTVLPEEALLAGADFAVRHEGEQTLVELIRFLRGDGNKGLSAIQGLSYRDQEVIRHNPDRPFLQNLDGIPPANFSLIEKAEKINMMPIQTSRGCPFNCEFCSVSEMFGRKVRYRSPENVVREIKSIKSGKHIFVVDDNFSANRLRTKALLETMKSAGINRSWSTQERVSVAQEEEILKLMRETGCERLYQGIESFNAEVLKEWKKGQLPEEIRQAVSILHRHGFSIHGMFVLGGDADTLQTIEQTIVEAMRCKIDTAQFFTLVPPPGTKLYQRLEAEGRILTQNWSLYDGQHAVIKPKQMSPWQLQELAIKAFQDFYSLRRGINWLLRGKFNNGHAAFFGRYATNKWLKENRDFLEALKEGGA